MDQIQPEILNFLDEIEGIIDEGTTKGENDFIINDPDKFDKEYNHYLTYKNIDDFTLIALVESKYFSKSNELILNKSELITPDLFKTLMTLPSSSTIQILRLQGLQIKGRAIKLLSKCRFINLKELEIDSCPHIESEAIDSFFLSNEAMLKNLKTIIFKKINIEDSCITSILNASQKLKELKEMTFSECNKLSPMAFDSLFSNDKFDKLRLLHFEKINISDKVLSKFSLSERLCSLEQLTLIKLQGLNDACLVDLFKSPYLTSLKYLEIRNLTNIKGFFLSEFQSKTADLVSFKIADLNNLLQDKLENFLKLSPFPNLKVLEISQMNQILDGFISVICDLQFSELEELTLNYYLKMTASSLVSLLSSPITNSIKMLNLENCTGLSDFPSNLASLSKCMLKKLEKLNLNYCTKLSPYLIQGISTIVSLENLKILSLNGVTTLDDVTSLYLAKSNIFKNLQELYLENCPNISIKSFQELMRGVMTKKLEVLSLDGNSQFNDEIWTPLTKSPNLTNLKDIRLRGLNITSDGIDKLIFSDKMINIEIMYLTDACIAFPSFYETDKCSKLKRIEGSWENVTTEQVENLLNSTVLSTEFQFQQITNKVIMDDSLMNVLTDSIFFKKIWEFPQCDIREIESASIEKMLASPNVNPFFNIDRFLKEMKSIINDAILESMSNNPLCVNNLFDIDLVGCKNVNVEGIQSILLSKSLCPLFNASGFIQSIKYCYLNQADQIISLLSKGNFARMLRKLDLGDYQLDLGIFNKILLKPNVFKNLRTLNLSATQIDDKCLMFLAQNDLMALLIVLNLDNNPTISTEGFQAFFEFLSSKPLFLKRLDLEYCKINNNHLKIITEGTFGKQLRYISLAGCKDIDGEGLLYILDLFNRLKRINMKNIYEDFKYIINLDDKKQYSIRKEVNADINEIYNFILNKTDGKGKKVQKAENEKKRFMIRDKVIMDLCKEKRMENIKKIDMNNCAITSKVLFEIANSIYLKQLQLLNLENTNIDDEGIIALCSSRSLPNIVVLETNYCSFLRKPSLVSILTANFHKDYNPDKMLSHFSSKVDSELLKMISESKFFGNMTKLNFTQNNDFNINDLNTLIVLQKKNLKLEINININQILDKNKSEISDKVLIDLADSKIFSQSKTLDLAGSKISEEGLQAIFVSKYIHPNFIIQPLINSFANLIDDDILNAISRGSFFRNITEINLKGCPKISILGLLNIVRNPNPDFYIQGLLDDFGEKIDSLFIKNIVQQDYFENLNNLILTNCKRLTTGDLLTIIKASHEDFDLESFIKPENLPNNNNSDLITNEVVKAISQSAYFQKKFIDENTDDDDRVYFDFNIRLYRQIDYGINHFIEHNVAPIEDYDDYLQNFSFYLSFKSLSMINKIYEGNANRWDVQSLKEQLGHVTKLDLSQNKQIYNTSFKSRLTDAFESFQNQYNLNLENETIEHFVKQVIQVQDEFTMSSDADEEYKDLLIFNLIKNCPRLEEINLNNLNLGDYFLKLFSLYIAEEKKDLSLNLPVLNVFKLRNNSRFTSVGLKYLYCSAVRRTNIEYIDVTYKGQVSSGITYFVNNGLIGMIDYYLLDSWNKIKNIYAKKKKRFLKFFFNRLTLSILGMYFFTSPILLFHLLEKVFMYVPIILIFLLRPFKKVQRYYKNCLSSCLNCFGGYLAQLQQGREREPSSGNAVVKAKIVKRSICLRCLQCLPCLKYNEEEELEESVDFHDGLRQRFSKSMNNLREYVGKDYEIVKNQSLFYFDESLVILNMILGAKHEIKNNQIFTSNENELSDFGEHLSNKFHFISKLKWIFLLNFIAYYTITIFYLIFIKVKFNQNADILSQIPYFAYAFVTFIVEAGLCWEVINIIKNPLLINYSSSMLIMNIISSQAAKYDLFTDVSFVLSNYNANPNPGQEPFGKIFIASLIILLLKMSLNLKEFLSFFIKSFLKKKKNKAYSSKYINSFSKVCFTFEFHGLGRLLDKFSTASAQKYRYWWLPKSLYNIYIPMVITATFTRLFIEDIPQLIIQTFDIIDQNKSDFTTLASLFSTIFTLFLTLHTAWNVRPSYFSRDLFKLYHYSLMYAGQNGDEESESENSSHMDSSFFDHSEHRSVQSYEDKNGLQIIENKEDAISEKDEEREELFGGKQKKVDFKTF